MFKFVIICAAFFAYASAGVVHTALATAPAALAYANAPLYAAAGSQQIDVRHNYDGTLSSYTTTPFAYTSPISSRYVAGTPAAAFSFPAKFVSPAGIVAAPGALAAPASVVAAPTAFAAPAHYVAAPATFAAPAQYAAPAGLVAPPAAFAAPAQYVAAPAAFSSPANYVAHAGVATPFGAISPFSAAYTAGIAAPLATSFAAAPAKVVV